MWLLGLLLLLSPAFGQETFFEGDILLTNDAQSRRSPEMVLQDPNKLWPNGVVPYAFDEVSAFTVDQKEIVRRSMDGIEDKTGCLNFLEVERSRGGDMVIVTMHGLGDQTGSGCWAHLGRVGALQAVNLSPGCIDMKTVTHELLHSIGVIHEHTRPDRDEYVKILKENVDPRKIHNFDRHNWTEFESIEFAYDYKSIMHYPINAFSKKEEDPTIITIQPLDESFESIGTSPAMSGIDAIEVAVAYNCTPKPETLVEFVNDNVWILQTVQQHHSENIKHLMEKVEQLEATVSKGFDCSPPWTWITTGCYWFVPAKMNQPDAVNYCLSLGAHLVEIGSQEEQDGLVQFLQKKLHLDRHKSVIWIGLSDSTSEGDFVLSSSGQIPPYTNWSPNEPNDAGGNEDCAHMRGGGTWNDRSCSNSNVNEWTYHALCEK